MLIAGQGLTQSAPNCFIHTAAIVGQQTAQRVVGAIHRQDTGGRGNPPECLSEFGCAGTPFAFGHVMALELGGCDISANIVPQYGQWQGNAAGEWRAMERAVNAARTDADIFIVDIAYQSAPFAETYEAQCDRFSGSERLFHWREPRIPLRFRVWTVATGWSSGSVNIAAYFAADDAGKERAIAGLIGALPDTRLVFDATISNMPEIDRDYWRKQMLNIFVRREYLKYERQIKRDNEKKMRIYERQREAVQQHVQRSSPRANVKSRSGIPKPPKEVVPLGMAKWLQDEKVAQDLVDLLTDITAPPSAVTGWSAVDKTKLTMNYLLAALFQQ
jgi:hypothetical protein